MHIWIEEVTDFLVVIFKGLQDKERWDNEEDLSVSLFQKFGELLVLLSCCLNDLAEMKKLVALL